MTRLALPLTCTLAFAPLLSVQSQKKPAAPAAKSSTATADKSSDAEKEKEKESFLENPWQLGLLLQDTNGDKIADAVCGHVIVAANPSAAENTAAANLAARIGYETSAMTLPIVVQGAPQAVAGCPAPAQQIWIGESALPAASAAAVHNLVATLGLGEGAVVAVDGGLAIVGPDPVGLLTAADAFAERAPFLWTIPGDKISVTAKNINAALLKGKSTAKVSLQALIFAAGGSGVRRALLTSTGTIEAEALQKLLKPEEGTPVSLGPVREVQIQTAAAPITVAGAASARTAALPAMPESGADLRTLDLARLYTVKGLLTGSAKKPIPSGTVAKLYVPAGAPGVAMANLAARLGLETVGITMPLALPAAGITPAQVQGTPVVAEGSPAADHLKDLLTAKPNSDLDKLQPGGGKSLPSLPAGQGELRVVDHAAGKSDALLIRGDDAGAAAAMDYAATHLPYLWEPGKRYASVEEVRDDLRHFFTHKSDAGQVTAALYHLDRWSAQLAKDHPSGLTEVQAEIFVDEVDPKLQEFVRAMLSERLHTTNIQVVTGSKHAGTKCCSGEVPMHLQSEVAPFQQASPTFAEDLTFEWEGKRMLAAAKRLAASAPADKPMLLQAGVSESPQQRKLLAQQLRSDLDAAGLRNVRVEVLSAYKQGYSWLVDAVEPALAGKHAERLTIEFAPYRDPHKQSAMRTEERWIQELYPVDEILARDLKLPLANVALKKMESDSGPTYRVHAFDHGGKEVFTQDFTAYLHQRPYSAEFRNYEQIGIETGWVTLTDAAGKQIATERIPTDTEMFWEHYQDKTMPRIVHSLLAQNNGKPKLEYQPLFDTIQVDFHMSEPDYALGLDQERISSLEGLQEDLLFATQNSFYIFGNTFSTGIMDYMGRVVPIAHLSDEGKDPHIRVEYYSTDAAHPEVKLAWKAGEAHGEWARDLPALTSGDPRLVAARVQSGLDQVAALTWSMPVASREDNFQEWRNLVTEDALEHTVLSAEEARAQLNWLGKLHTAGLYTARLSYPHLQQLDFEFELPLELHPPEHTKAETVSAQASVIPPPHPRPQITDVAPAPQKADKTYVQWDQPIGLEENARLLSRLSTFPGVDVYWMGRSYMGNNIWAADIMLPTPSTLRSMAKETTLKAAIIYSGRQHANEVSSTSHIQRLAEELMLDPTRRKALDKVNVVIHPVTNPDGAELAMDLARITPDNMLHAGYHASLTADMVTGQWDQDPVYPESRTRRQLWEAWLPDGFLNPHGYPSHEWVQPFSEYSAWVISRTGAELGRAWWAPRGWFTSLYYFNDPEHPQSKTVNYTLRDYIVNSMSTAPGVLDMNARMNGRYFRYGQQWDQRAFQQPIYKGVRVYMAVTGQQPGARSAAFSARFPDVTYDDGYTEAPDETARGPWLHLVAGAGLAYDHAHLQFLSDGKFKIKRTQKEFFDGVQWSVNRDRPVLPDSKPFTTPATPAQPGGTNAPVSEPAGRAGEPLDVERTPAASQPAAPSPTQH
ncbi:M14 family metallopeptidase [Terriglobus sp.]|uniref:M14 family metallopeptidase n=1 Tax=Terriglobus sp. TaxID=1889013 RepID=UPI003AFF84B3